MTLLLLLLLSSSKLVEHWIIYTRVQYHPGQERIWHPAILQSMFESSFCNYLCKVICLTNVAVIEEINTKNTVLIKISDAPDNCLQGNTCSSHTHTYMCNNGLEMISVCNGDWNKSASRLVTITCCVRDLESFSVVMYCQRWAPVKQWYMALRRIKA